MSLKSGSESADIHTEFDAKGPVRFETQGLSRETQKT